MATRYFLHDIEWAEPRAGLPDEAYVELADAFVQSEDIDEAQWNEAVNVQLERQFGRRAVWFAMEGDD